jgi:hypothetical protein
MVGAHARSSSGFAASALRLPSVGAEERRAARTGRRDHGLPEPHGRTPAARGRPALCRPEAGRTGPCAGRRPKLLMLDEPAAGLNHEELHALTELVRDIRNRRGITVLLVEHHMSMVMGLSDHIVALNFGKKIAEGTPDHDPEPPRRHRSLPRSRRPWLRSPARGLGPQRVLRSHAGAARGGFRLEQGPHHCHPGRQRCRQDDHACAPSARWCAPPAACASTARR